MKKNPIVPGYDGRFEAAVIEVDDPFEADAKLSVAINARHDVVAYMRSRRWIDDAQYQAGNQFLGLLELAEEARGLAVDPSREVVDCASSRVTSPEITEARERAISELRRISRFLGNRDYRWACLVIRDNTAIGTLARLEARDARYMSQRFYDILTDLGIYFHKIAPVEK